MLYRVHHDYLGDQHVDFDYGHLGHGHHQLGHGHGHGHGHGLGAAFASQLSGTQFGHSHHPLEHSGYSEPQVDQDDFSGYQR